MDTATTSQTKTRHLEYELRRRLEDPEFVAAYGKELARAALAIAVGQARREMGLTQRELAERIGHSQPYVAQLEGGDANPTIGAAGAILAALGRRIVIQTAPLATEDRSGAPAPPKALMVAEGEPDDGYSV